MNLLCGALEYKLWLLEGAAEEGGPQGFVCSLFHLGHHPPQFPKSLSSLLIRSQWPWVPLSTGACHRVGDCPWAQLQPNLPGEVLLHCSSLQERHICHRLWVWGTSFALLCSLASVSAQSSPHSPAHLIVFFLSHSLPSFVCSFGESSWLSAAYQNLTAMAQGHCVAHPSPGHPCQAYD